jgi:hypothetical protein
VSIKVGPNQVVKRRYSKPLNERYGDFSPIVRASRFGTIPEHGTEMVLPGVQRTRFECREQGFSNGVGLER